MSGLEVVGLVLSVLPLAIEAVKSYRSILSSISGADHDLNALLQDLKTEQVCLRNTFEILLNGVAPLLLIDTLIETPFGPAWKPYSDQLRLRLWTSSGEFEEQVAEMEKLAQELKDKLCIQPDGKTRLTDHLAILQELKRGTSFTLKRNEYENIISRIKTINSNLHRLTGQNRQLESGRLHRSQARVATLIRGLSQSIFNALRNALTCSCVKSHEVCLELVHRSLVLTPDDPDDQVAKDCEFHVVLGSYGDSSRDKATEAVDIVEAQQQPARWDSVYLQYEEFGTVKKDDLPPPSPTPTVATPQKTSKRVRWNKFSRSKSAKEATVLASQTLLEVSKSLIAAPVKTVTSAPALVSNLCQVVLKRHKEPSMEPAEDCYGYITDLAIERNFGLRERQPQPESRSVITLRQVLEGKEAGLPPFNYPKKLKVALALAVSILHLYKTPWLATIVTLDDVVFLRGDGVLPPYDDSPYRPFLAKNLPRELDILAPEHQQRQVLNMDRPLNLTILSLAALLIQVIIGEAVDALDLTGCKDKDSIVSKYRAGGQFDDQIMVNGGPNYANAVTWCLGKFYETYGLGDNKFCQDFYVSVVARLEEDEKRLTNDYM